MSREDLIKHIVSKEFNRFTSYYKNARDISLSKNAKRDDRKKRDDRDRKAKKDWGPEERTKAGFTRFHINAGTKTNMTARRLIGIINEALDSSSAEIGKIDLLKRFGFFEIDSKVAAELKSAVNGTQFGSIKLEIEESNDRPAVSTFERKKFKKKGFTSRKERGEKKKFNKKSRFSKSKGGGGKRRKKY